VDHIIREGAQTSSGIEWDPESTLLATMPAWLPVNRELPPTLNLRIVSRIFGGKPEVLAAGGNNLVALRRRLQPPARVPKTIVVDLIPDHIETLVQFDQWLAATGVQSRVLTVGPAVEYWDRYLAEQRPRIGVAPAGNPIVRLGGVPLDQARDHLSPTTRELERQPVWEKRRIAVGYGCPAACELCPRKADQGTARALRPPGEVLD
jgi:hypothetical protein